MSLNDIFGPSDHRPEHEDFRLLVDIVLQHDGKTESPNLDMDEYLATLIDPRSVSYMALQRSMRMAKMMGQAGDPGLIMRLSSLWIDGFLLGHGFHERRSTT